MVATMDISDRFLDLLEVVEDDPGDYDEYMTLGTRILDMPRSDEEWSHGPLLWNTPCSVELQRVVDSFNMVDLYNIKFSVTIADPVQPDFPLVACSAGFSDLTGYMLPEIVGRNCRFLLNGVPPTYINDQARFHARDFCIVVNKGLEYNSRSEVLPPGIKQCGPALPKGEVICVQTNAMKTGELFKNMFFLKQVWLDEQPYIIGLQAGVAEDYEDADQLQELQHKCQYAWKRLGIHMTQIEQFLCSSFWYSGSMRRQD